MNQSSFRRLDLHELLHKHKPSVAKWFPRYIIQRLARIVHLDLINDFLETHFDEHPLQFLRSVVDWMQMDLSLVNGERLHNDLGNRPIIVANHPLGGPESVLLMHEISRTYPDFRMVSKEILLKLKPMAPLLASIPKHDDRRYARNLLEVFKGDQPLLLFPAGYCSRPLSSGDVYDYAWFKTFIKVARRYNRPVIAVHISGLNSRKFYRLSTLRRMLRIKASFESVLLVDEMLKQRGKSIVMTVGKPIFPNQFSREVDDFEWAQRVRQYVFHLGSDAELDFNPALPSTLILA